MEEIDYKGKFQKIKQHFLDAPGYWYIRRDGKISERRYARYKRADKLMEGALTELGVWYNELAGLLGISREQLLAHLEEEKKMYLQSLKNKPKIPIQS